jgi:hypothetical protein
VVWLGRDTRMDTACLVEKKNCKIFKDFLSHEIFGRMHETLNVDKKNKTNYTV